MNAHSIKLDFSNKTVNFTKCRIWAKKWVTITPNSETVLWDRVPKNICTGFQDACSGISYANRKKLLVARSLAVVSTNC